MTIKIKYRTLIASAGILIRTLSSFRFWVAWALEFVRKLWLLWYSFNYLKNIYNIIYSYIILYIKYMKSNI